MPKTKEPEEQVDLTQSEVEKVRDDFVATIKELEDAHAVTIWEVSYTRSESEPGEYDVTLTASAGDPESNVEVME